MLHNNQIVWDCVVIRNLSVQLLIGEPGKLDNDIITLPNLKKVRTKDINGNRFI